MPTNNLLSKMHTALHAYFQGVGSWAEYEQAKEELQASEHLEDNGQRVLVQRGEDTVDLLGVGIGGIGRIGGDDASNAQGLDGILPKCFGDGDAIVGSE